MKHQAKYLIPAIGDVYNKEHETLLASVKENKPDGIIAIGDGRADSPGTYWLDAFVFLFGILHSFILIVPL